MLDFFQQIFFTVVGTCNQGVDVFFAISGFLGVYKCLQIYDANGGYLTFRDSMRLIVRKFFRLAPMTYFIFFLTWASISRLEDGPLWINTQSLFYQCDKYWWAQILFIGNLVPYFTEVTLGCFYWGWAVYADF
jgi:peptidoglycan/LPS O-acetylase OafA/YrhL